MTKIIKHYSHNLLIGIEKALVGNDDQLSGHEITKVVVIKRMRR